MGNNKNNTDSDGVCEKIYKAIWCVSPNGENPKREQKFPENQAVSSEIPVIFNTPLFAPSKENEQATKKIGQVSKIPTKTELAKTKVLQSYDTVKPKREGKPLGNNNVDGDGFSNYISRSKEKIRTTSSVGGGREMESLARLDSLDTKVGEYIKRTKMKIRAMSGIGGGRAPSIK